MNNLALITCHFKRHGHTDEHRIFKCYGDLRHVHTTKMTTNKTKTITDYLGRNGIRVQKSICSRQLGSSLQSGLFIYYIILFHVKIQSYSKNSYCENLIYVCTNTRHFLWSNESLLLRKSLS